MNRALVLCLVSAALTSACGPALQPADVVARVGEHRLTAERLEALMKSRTPGSDPAVAVPAAVRAWIDLNLAADAFAGGVDLADSAFLAEVMAPRQAAEVLVRLRQALAARRPGLRPGEVDRLYASDSTRTLQQILIPVPDWRDSGLVAVARRRADSVLALRSRGESFTALARRYSVQLGPYGGVVTVVWRQAVPEQVRKEIFALRPGGTMAGRIPIGFAIVHRPLLGDVRSELTGDLLAAVNGRADSIFADSVVKVRKLIVAPDGVSHLRIALSAAALTGDTKVLAHFQGGELSTRRALLWVGTVQDQVRGDFAEQSDSALAGLLFWAARNELLSEVAREFGVEVTWRDLAASRSALLASLAPLQGQFRGLADEASRTRRVDSLLGAMGRGESVPTVPGILANVLRRRATIAIDQGSLAALVQRLRMLESLQRPPIAGRPLGQ